MDGADSRFVPIALPAPSRPLVDLAEEDISLLDLRFDNLEP